VSNIKESTLLFVFNFSKRSFTKLGYVGSLTDVSSRRFLAGLSGRSATLELKSVPSSLFEPAVKNIGQSRFLGPSNVA
jgi:hypothetical protein